MRKIGVFLLFLLIASFAFVYADEEISETNNKTNLALECLNEKIGNSCEKTADIQELALTILARPKNVNSCVSRLKANISNNNLGSIKNTALGIIALKNAGEDVSKMTQWLSNRSIVPIDITWYIQEHSNGESICKVKYNGSSYNFSISPIKKIVSTQLGRCLEIDSSFWFKINPSCYGTTFEFSCESDFKTNIMYSSSSNQNTFYVLDNTQSANSYGSIKMKVDSKCFPKRFGETICSYEDTLWAVYALHFLGKDISSYLPYLNAMAINNKNFLPYAFLTLVNSESSNSFSSQLLEEQKTEGNWFASGSAYNKFYDTALALLALGVNNEMTQKAESWLWYNQNSQNGCWANSVRDTAIVLWSLSEKETLIPLLDVTYCEIAGFYCVLNSQCSSVNDLGNQYYCSGSEYTCCKESPIKSCSASGGKTCASGYTCSTTPIRTTDSDNCCIGNCLKEEVIPTKTVSECENEGFLCMSSCNSEYYTTVSYNCDSSSKICCKRLPSSNGDDEVPFFIWIIVFAILIAVGIMIYIYREKIKLMFFKSKIKKNSKDGNSNNMSSSGRPPFTPGNHPGIYGNVPPRRPPVPSYRPGSSFRP